ncbi:MAG: sigma-70 family RNA polymerase sigma factor [bacterium]|nr:sigma-70 family RNA polymerase sigma factor [bacterium]
MYDPMPNITSQIDYAVDRYQNMVYRIAMNQVKNKEDADDVFQEVFLKYITYVGKSKDGEPFATAEHEKAWLIRVTINTSINHLKKAWHKKVLPLTEDIPIKDKEDRELYQVVLKLPQKYRTVIHLFYYEDMSVHEISSQLDIKESTIREQLTRARRLLKKYLKGDYDYV